MQELLATRPTEPIPALVRHFLRRSTPIVRVAVTGPPYSGRHVLARKIAETFDLPLIDPDVLLEAADPQLQALVRVYRKRRRALPPGLAFSLVRKEIFNQDCVEKGWMLCGFPESRAQDDLFRRRGICAQKTIILDVSPETARDRCSDSLYDPLTKRTFNKENLPADAEVLQRLTAPPCDAPEEAAQMARHFSYESTVLQKSLVGLSREDPCCVVFNGDQPSEDLVREALHFVSIRPIQHRPYMHRVLFVGRPGTGKKTIADKLVSQLRLCHVSSGNLIMRAATDPENDNFREINMFFSRERAVPDDIVAGMVVEQLKESELQGFVLRGFPRSLMQADLLAQLGFQPSKVFFFNLPEEVATTRLLEKGKKLLEKAQPLADRYTVTEMSPRTSRFKANIKPGFRDEEAQLADIKEQNRVFAENEVQMRAFYKSVTYDIDASLPVDDMFSQIKYHLLHPRPLRPVDKSVMLDDEPVASFISEQIEVEQW